MIIVVFLLVFSVVAQSDKGFPVTVNGGYFNSGTFYFPPAFRLLDVLKASCDSVSWDKIPRNIEVDGTTIDIYKYLANNDESQNPEIKAGMKIKIPYPIQTVTVLGEIKAKFIGTIPINSNENIKSLLSLFTKTSLTDSNKVLLTRNKVNLSFNKDCLWSF